MESKFVDQLFQGETTKNKLRAYQSLVTHNQEQNPARVRIWLSYLRSDQENSYSRCMKAS
jgi:hypothetical protein